ncbi:hypothetical protein [Fodinicola acaciae]|uniref:hypothetical protein n=1 Tax=Fodinicola acaciae TaxID=2681555 RepID=UPI0013D31E34|nr:hypothetical protein [Fodinicola acaciae]
MRLVRTLLAGIFSVLALAVTPMAANAATQSLPAPNGYFYLCADYNLGGPCAHWGGYSLNTGSYGTTALSAWNNGYATSSGLDDVLVYHDVNFTGATRGIYRSAILSDLRMYRYDGQTYTLAKNIRSFRWVNLP